MTFELRMVVVGLAVFTATSAGMSLLVPFLARRITATEPIALASALFRLRLWPAAAACATTIMAVASFVVFEQRDYLESTGVVLPVLAGLASLLWLASAVRVVVLARSTRRLLDGWMTTASPVTLEDVAVPAFAITSTFPVVAVIGTLRPRLLIARSVLAACTPAQIRAILAHENAHLASRDNLKRALLAVSPDPIAWLPMAARLRAAWNEAVEESADDAAGTVGEEGRIDLADALIKVARLGATTGRPMVMPASALYRGENLDRRVRRLLEPVPAVPTAARRPWRRWTTVVAGLAGAVLALEAVHVVVELAVTFLP